MREKRERERERRRQRRSGPKEFSKPEKSLWGCWFDLDFCFPALWAQSFLSLFQDIFFFSYKHAAPLRLYFLFFLSLFYYYTSRVIAIALFLSLSLSPYCRCDSLLRCYYEGLHGPLFDARAEPRAVQAPDAPPESLPYSLLPLL